MKNPEQSFEREVDPRSIAIVTGTYYPTWEKNKEIPTTDQVRGDLALEMIARAKEKGYRVIAGDVGSSPEFLDSFQGEGIALEDKRGRGMSAARQESFREASRLEGAQVIVWTEAEKVSLVEECLENAIQPILDGRADIVIPKRDAEAWATYPPFQAEIEQRANRKWNELLREQGLLSADDDDLDVWFGPKFFRNDPEILRLFTEAYSFDRRDLKLDKLVNPGAYSNALFFPVMQALSRGYRVVSASVPYRNPAAQTAWEKDSPEFRRKREVQFKDILTNTIHFLRMLRGGAKSRLRKIAGSSDR